MIKVNYVFKGKLGEIELGHLTSFESKEDVLESVGTSTLEHIITEDVLKILNSEIDPTPVLVARERGGDRGEPISPQSEAERLGFSKLVATIDDSKVVIIE
ncbi:hypothetical protein L4C36_17120 [Photobacterium japonica]|uniref:hypothetical protein n=1 Tax=Photobacterium japonica TaxID=2910235 RepID=UPI003D101638